MTQMQEMLTTKRPAWLTFAAIVMFAIGILRVISAIYYFADSARINNLTNGAFAGHTFLWGLWDLGIAVLAVWAGYSLLSGDMFGRVVAYAWSVLVIIQSFMIIGWTPWFATAMLVLAALVIYGVSVTEEYQEPRGAPPG